MTDAQSDLVLRAITDDDSFRVITTDTTHTVLGACSAQGLVGNEARQLAELLTGTILFRETMSPDLRVQGIVRNATGEWQLVGDSHPSGDTRGLVTRPESAPPLALGPGSALRMLRTLPDGRINQGVVEIPAPYRISTALMAYMHSSEQIVSMVAVGTLLDEQGAITRAGGYLVQLIPGAKQGPLMVMTERLQQFEELEPLLARPEFSPKWLMEELLFGMGYCQLHEAHVRFNCWCDEQRVLGALATLPAGDLDSLMESAEPLEIDCDYCHRPYRISPEQLAGLRLGTQTSSSN